MFYIYEIYGNWSFAKDIPRLFEIAIERPIIFVHEMDLLHQIKGYALIQGRDDIEVRHQEMLSQSVKPWDKANRDQVFTYSKLAPVPADLQSKIIKW